MIALLAGLGIAIAGGWRSSPNIAAEQSSLNVLVVFLGIVQLNLNQQ